MVERDKALDMALGQIEKQFGKGSVMKMGDKTTMAIESVPALWPSTLRSVSAACREADHRDRPGVLGQDHPRHPCRGRGTGNGGTCAYIDAEHAMDPVYAKAIGVDIDELLISQPDTGEQALEIADITSAPVPST